MENSIHDTILIIEAGNDMLRSSAEILELANYKIITANNGLTGLELARKCRPDLILCDVKLPELDGYGVLRAIEHIPDLAGVPFVFLSHKADIAEIRHGMDMGADDFLKRPFDGEELLHIVSARLKKRRNIRESIEGSSMHLLDEFINSAGKHPDIKILSDHRKTKKLKKKDMLFMEGDKPSYLYYVISGKVKVFKSNEQGKEFIINILKDGDFTGYVALLEDEEHKVAAMALEETEIALIPKEDFFQLLFSNHEVTLKFVKLLSRNFAETREKLLKLAYDSARKRVSEAIIYAYKKYMKEGKNEMSFNLLREDISALSGISCESVSRNLTDFREEGLIETHFGNIRILDLNKLERLRN